MHAILAFSARHFNHLQPGDKKYSIAFALHYVLSLSSYSLQLGKGFDSSNADATIASSYLHTMLAFQNVRSQSNHEVDADGGGEFTWLRAMRGVSILWDASDMRYHLNGSVLLHMEKDGTYNGGKAHSSDSWALEISREMHNLFGVDCDPDTSQDSYEGPLSSVCQRMQLGNGQEMICRFMSFVGELPSSFVQLLDQNDPRALLLLCYWSALLGQIDSWWVMGPANVVCRRLCGYLDAIPEQRIHDLLRFPAGRCGYIMKESFRKPTEELLQLQNGRAF
ncbi:hypothetical protein MFRU_019g00960 [Monilinia fructicola]|nr:hypothetical protein MFRU_019g00960 [Monilinia fructicola]